MKKLIWTVLMAVTAILVISCDRESIDYTGGSNGGSEVKAKGTASFASLSLSVDLNLEAEVTPRSVNTDNFIIRIYDKDSGIQEGSEYKYAALPPTLELPVGQYYVVALSAEQQTSGWDTPFYYDRVEFSIEEDQTTTVDGLVCKLQNIMVTIEFSENMKPLMEEDYKIEISGTAGGVLTFTDSNISQAGYLQAFDEKTGTVYDELRATFTGTVDGEELSLGSIITGVKAGEHCVIKYRLVEVGSGTGNIDVTFDAECANVDKDYEIDPGNSTNPGTDPGTNPEPGKITIEGVGYDISQAQEIVLGEDIAVKVTASEKIADIYLRIFSSDEYFEVDLHAMGLGEFSLVNPADQAMEDLLRSFEFPIKDEVANKTSITFNVSFGLLSMLAGYEGVHEFEINVTDTKDGSHTETLTIKVEY